MTASMDTQFPEPEDFTCAEALCHVISISPGNIPILAEFRYVARLQERAKLAATEAALCEANDLWKATQLEVEKWAAKHRDLTAALQAAEQEVERLKAEVFESQQALLREGMERDSFKKLWERRHAALAHPCLQCGYVQKAVKPMEELPFPWSSTRPTVQGDAEFAWLLELRGSDGNLTARYLCIVGGGVCWGLTDDNNKAMRFGREEDAMELRWMIREKFATEGELVPVQHGWQPITPPGGQ